HELPARAARVPGRVRDLEMALRDEARHGRRREARHAELGRPGMNMRTVSFSNPNARVRFLSFAALSLAASLAACAIHPAGEEEERDRAAEIGRTFEEAEAPPPLSENPALDDYLRTAFYASADLRARYWEWRAALERIPQEASPPNPALTFSY